MHKYEQFLARALALAWEGLTLTSPNPRVGCVLTDADGEIIGEGHTQRAGGAHAEIMALQDAERLGHSTVGATAYVTLEPCAHQGKTGPCCNALAAAGIAKVVCTNLDPNPLVAGQGFAFLEASGIQVQLLDKNAPFALEALELNIGFFSRMIRKTPWVRLKIAASLDGRTALPQGDSKWITDEEARADGHQWRARACAVLTGIGTILQDDPLLNVRIHNAQRQPHLVVVDSHLNTPLDARIFVARRAVYIYTAVQNPAKKQALETRGATIIYLPDLHGKVDLRAMMEDLARREINEVHVEAGQTLNGALIRNDLVDEFIFYLAPKLIGKGLDIADIGPIQQLSSAVNLNFKSVAQIGPDLRILARVAHKGSFWKS